MPSVDGWSDRAERAPFWTLTKILVVLVVIGFGIAALVYGIETGGSYWWGKAGVVQQRNSTGNIIEQNAELTTDKNAVDTDKVKLKQARDAVTNFERTHPDYAGNGTPYDPDATTDANLNIVVQGLETDCLNHVQDFNTALQSVLATSDAKDVPPLSTDSCQ